MNADLVDAYARWSPARVNHPPPTTCRGGFVVAPSPGIYVNYIDWLPSSASRLIRFYAFCISPKLCSGIVFRRARHRDEEFSRSFPREKKCSFDRLWIRKGVAVTWIKAGWILRRERGFRVRLFLFGIHYRDPRRSGKKLEQSINKISGDCSFFSCSFAREHTREYIIHICV